MSVTKDATTTTTSKSSSGNVVRKLRELRLLPPPCNDLVPVLSTIGVFATLNLILGGQNGIQQQWKTCVDESMSALVISPESLFVYGTWMVYMTMYWGYSLLGHTAEHLLLLVVLKEFKIQPSAPITTWSEVWNMMPLVLFNQVCLAIPMLKVFYQIMLWRVGSVHNLLYDVPSGIGRFAFMMWIHVISVEIWFYTMHRLLHTNTFLYRNVHYLHHTYTTPSWVESVYVHPVEFILNSFPVLLVGPILTGAPLLVTGMWIWTVTFLQVHDHAGYCLPFTPKVLMHDLHHQKPNSCYGVIGLLDGIVGTSGVLDDYVKEFLGQEESKKKQEESAVGQHDDDHQNNNNNNNNLKKD